MLLKGRAYLALWGKPHGNLNSNGGFSLVDDSILSVLIIDGESEHALKVLRCLAHAPRVKVHVLSSVLRTRIRSSRHYTSFHHHNHTLDDEENYLEEIGTVARRENIKVLLPVDEPGVRFAAKHRAALEEFAKITPVPELDTFETATDKWLLGDFMQRQGIPTPKTIPCVRGAGFGQRLDEMTFPVLLKPTRGRGGQGIRRFDDRHSLETFLEGNHEGPSFPYIIQNIVQGYDVDCSVLCEEGQILAHTIQKTVIPNPLRFSPALSIEFVRHDEALQVVGQLVAALRLTGVVHFDLLVDEADQRVKVLEMNARYWQSLMGSLTMGVNFPYLSCLVALNKPLSPDGYQCGRYIDLWDLLHVMANKSLAKNLPGFKFSEIGWRHLLADPGPILWRGWNKLRDIF